MHSSLSEFENIAYVFQGGGALGAYQVGVFQALLENGYEPTWMIGTSIGAINAGIIAGNRPEDRLRKLKEFWDIIGILILPGFTPKDELSRRWYNYISALTSLIYGQSSFFYPRLDLLALFSGPTETESYYALDPLRQTLEKLIDFDILNSGNIRYTIGAVEITQGKSIYFDNHKQKINVEHILASCALPPGFPAIEVEGDFYWDGGVLSNSPTEVLINEPQRLNTLCFMANIFDSYGLLPKSMDDVLKRYKDITYSSRYRSQIQSLREKLKLENDINLLYNKLPDYLKNDPAIKKIHDSIRETIVTIHFVRFLYTAPSTELSSKGYEFSKLSIKERFETGYQDGLIAVKKSPWKSVIQEKVAIHEICSHTTLLEIMDKENQLKKEVATTAIVEGEILD